eukprot:252471_1
MNEFPLPEIIRSYEADQGKHSINQFQAENHIFVETDDAHAFIVIRSIIILGTNITLWNLNVGSLSDTRSCELVVAVTATRYHSQNHQRHFCLPSELYWKEVPPPVSNVLAASAVVEEAII